MSSKTADIPVVILCGGEGTRMREETEFKPKPMVTIGGKPILWHIMKGFSHFGFNRFILCLGYRGDMIKEHFLHADIMSNDLTLRLGHHEEDKIHHTNDVEDWRITFAETGLKAQTGSRVKRVQKYVDTDQFMIAYGDGISDIQIDKLLEFHLRRGLIGTLSGVHPPSRFGVLDVQDDKVTQFREKPIMDEYINGGIYAFKKDMFDRLDSADSCVLEREPLGRLAKDGQLGIYKHDGFWHMMDTYKDYLDLNRMWDSGQAKWIL